MIFRDGVVRAVLDTWPGAQLLQVRIVQAPCNATELLPDAIVNAINYPQIFGNIPVDTRVIVEASALLHGLGTGGHAMVTAVPDVLPLDPPPSPGHLVKARYCPIQPLVMGADEEDSPWYESLCQADNLGRMPVIVADLHSSLPAIIAGIRRVKPKAKVAYIMADGGALPVWLSKIATRLREYEWISTIISCGQAFGGDIETVNIHSALLAARVVAQADFVVYCQGPGNLGTGTKWGFSGVSAAEALHATSILGGRPIAALRMSSADPRPRHYGISHHSLTVLTELTLLPVEVIMPVFSGNSPLEKSLGETDAEFTQVVQKQVADISAAGHKVITQSTSGLADALSCVPVELSTMGRSLNSDPAAFLAAAAAGFYAAQTS